ncbi:MAG: HD domain-containing protein [Candidatus Atribacteria bacterium]|nr:HD domain-containing protein [Candidatus Atribacteria bacterium]
MNKPLTFVLIIALLVLAVFNIVSFLANRRLRNRVREQNIILSSSKELSRMMYQLVDQEAFFKEMWKTLKQITNADEFTYFRFDKVDTLIPEFVDGVYREQIIKVRPHLGEGLSGKVALERKPRFLNNADKSPLTQHVPGTPKDDSALLASPVIFGSDLYGVILLTKLGGKNFNEKELKNVEIFMNIASAHIAGESLIATVRSGLVDMLQALITAVELKDTYTAGHSLRVSKIAELIATELKLPQKEIAGSKIGGLLHDIGKIGIDEKILKEWNVLSEEEKTAISKHPEYGYMLVKNVKLLNGVAETILYHHEWYNGKGYPKGLKGNEIPISSRIILVADAIDAMTSRNLLNPKKNLDETIAELMRFSGTQFDPEIVTIAINNKEKIAEILNTPINNGATLDDESLFENL